MKIAIILAASVLSFSALDTRAAALADVDTITVKYGDLDLDHMPGVVALYQRIKTAADRLCKPYVGQTLVSKRAYLACRDPAVSAAVVRVNRPMLSDYVAQQSGKPVPGASKRVAAR